ncbi:MAG TPA: SDR family oxidoreductase [Streptosporangiaceae bacterium]|nr:SDR family oxidoreductase [Streptosporangiaceae bacterium]
MSSVLITGASKGIGRVTATELTRRGHRVIATARDPRALDDLEVDQRIRLDVTDQASIDAAVAEAGEIDVLLSNAGVMSTGAVEATPADEIERLFTQNTTGAIRVTQAVLPQMRQRHRGRLLFVSSFLARFVLPGIAAYSASKAALESFAEGLAIELKPFGVDVVLAQPAPVSSGLLDNLTYYSLPDDPYGIVNDVRPEMVSTPQQVAEVLADLVEAPAVPLRVPVGPFAQQVIDRRDVAPYDQPFLLG